MLGEGRTINVTGNACYIEYVENYYENGIAKKKNDDDPEARMSDELKGEKGQVILKNLQKHGVLDENFYPLELSNSESAVLAYQIAIALDIKEMWKVFSDLWNISPNALRAAYNRGMEQKKTIKFLDEITPLLKV
ncbi:MAG: hypothetical protein V8T35_05070 [Prevotella sp.]